MELFRNENILAVASINGNNVRFTFYTILKNIVSAEDPKDIVSQSNPEPNQFDTEEVPRGVYNYVSLCTSVDSQYFIYTLENNIKIFERFSLTKVSETTFEEGYSISSISCSKQ